MVNAKAIPRSWNDILDSDAPLICGILNVTPDSFSDGGNYNSRSEIEAQLRLLIEEGATMIDVGAESTRLGANEVTSTQEISRLKNVFKIIRGKQFADVLFSIDTRHHGTALFAINNGFQIINDVSGATFDPKMMNIMHETEALVVLMHSRGTPKTMMSMTKYENLEDDIIFELQSRIDMVVDAGVSPKKIMIDPGIGFAKTPEQSLELISNIESLKRRLGYPIMVGLSRKTIVSFVMSGDAKSVPFSQRDAISAEMCKDLKRQKVDVVRVHNVAKTRLSLTSS